MLLRRRRVILGVLISSQMLTGCTSWKVVDISPRALVDSAHVSAILVRERGGIPYVLDTPGVAGDTLVGTVKRVARRIPLASIENVAIRSSNVDLTTLLVVGLVVLVVGQVRALGGSD